MPTVCLRCERTKPTLCWMCNVMCLSLPVARSRSTEKVLHAAPAPEQAVHFPIAVPVVGTAAPAVTLLPARPGESLMARPTNQSIAAVAEEPERTLLWAVAEAAGQFA